MALERDLKELEKRANTLRAEIEVCLVELQKNISNDTVFNTLSNKYNNLSADLAAIEQNIEKMLCPEHFTHNGLEEHTLAYRPGRI